MAPLFEDFGDPEASPPARSSPTAVAVDRYDDGFNAGWDDAMAQVDAEQSRIGAQLAIRLAEIDRDEREAGQALIADLEPALRDVFDKVLPHAVERTFLGCLMEEITDVLNAANEQLTVNVSPEDVTPMTRLLGRAGIGPTQAIVSGESALAMSQALITWTGQERRIDLDGVLSELDSAIDTFFETLDRGQNATDIKEAQNG
ncbi:hypothetical protein SAMN05444004_101469 [Jannaschia faecimaris]|uniref:Flagellar assembly protein FliH n=1 Tax=Jannaschia faecimaris TaxID=1244108 RepID=A0A1H3JYB0_9RHOB|nr:hypothetical protein [Jannaschia faecimaris]SDY44932.1 hypothetical protein SAMN05444004_101469 [Jannaschia faecimaris]